MLLADMGCLPHPGILSEGHHWHHRMSVRPIPRPPGQGEAVQADQTAESSLRWTEKLRKVRGSQGFGPSPNAKENFCNMSLLQPSSLILPRFLHRVENGLWFESGVPDVFRSEDGGMGRDGEASWSETNKGFRRAGLLPSRETPAPRRCPAYPEEGSR